MSLMNSMQLIKRRIASILCMPILLIIFIIETQVKETINIMWNNFDYKINLVGLILLPLIIFLIRNYINFIESIIIILLTIFIYQNLFTSFIENLNKLSEDYDMSDDMSFVIILPGLIIGTIFYGLFIDYLKNKNLLSS